MKTILFPTDFSATANNALKYTIEIAQLLSARILFLYTIRNYADRDNFIAPDKYPDKKQAEEALKQLTSETSAKIPCEYILRSGAFADEIKAVAKQQQIDLVVMGTEKQGDIPDALALLNSTTVDLISESVCPVLAIPSKARFQPIRKIVLAVDTETIEDIVLQPLQELAALFQAEVLLLTVFTERMEVSNNSSSVQGLLSHVKYSSHQLNSTDVIEGIQDFLKANQADMLTVIARKRNFLSSLFHDSITQKLALHVRIPLFVLTE